MFKVGDFVKIRENDWAIYEILELNSKGLPSVIHTAYQFRNGEYVEYRGSYKVQREATSGSWRSLSWVLAEKPKDYGSPVIKKIRDLQVRYKTKMEAKGLKCPYSIIE